MTDREIADQAARNLGLTLIESTGHNRYEALYGGERVSVTVYSNMSDCIVDILYADRIVLSVAYSIDHKRNCLKPDIVGGVSTGYHL